MIIFTELKREKDEQLYGMIARVKKNLLERHNIDVSQRRLRMMKIQFVADGWTIVGTKRRKGGGRKRKLSDAGFAEVIRAAEGTNARRLVKKRKFEATDGRQVKISRNTVKNYVKDLLVLSVPKIVGIRTHFDHHRKQRIASAKWWLSLSAAHQQGVWFSDEMAWYIQLKPNIKNDVKFVKKGEQSTTNIRRMHKGDFSQIFSLWWTINKGGVVAVKLYSEKMTVEFFQKVLREDLKPKIKDWHRSRQKLRWWYHDHVTNSLTLYVPQQMNAIFGVGRWLQFSPPLCREQDGFITIAASEKRREHQRRNMVPKTVCNCEPTSNGKQVPSSSPDLNLAEYAQGMLRSMLVQAVEDGEEVWRGNVKKKMMIVSRLVNKLNENKRFFQKLYDGHTARCQKVVDTNGGLT